MASSNLKFENGPISLSVNPDRVESRFQSPAGLSEEAIRGTIESIVRGEEKSGSIPLTSFVLPGDSLAIPVYGPPSEVIRILNPLLSEMSSAGIHGNIVRVICRETDADLYREHLPASVGLVPHDPLTEEKTSYLANSQRGSRIYLNREMLDSDVILPVIVPEPAGPDLRLGILHGLWPEFSRKESAAKLAKDYLFDARLVRREIREIAWLAGVVTVIVGLPSRDGIAELASKSPAEAQAWAFERTKAFWSFDFDSDADSVLLVADAPDGLSESRAEALLKLAVRIAGRYRRVVLWTQFSPDAIAAMEQELFSGQKATPSWTTRLRKIGRAANVSVLGNLPDDVADACEMILLDEPEDLQRQIDHSGRWILVPDAWGVLANFDDN